MKIVTLELQTSQPDKLKPFYTEVLGLPLISEDAQQFSVQAGFSTITFRKVTGKPEVPYHIAFHIPSNRVREAANWLYDRVAFLYAPGVGTPVVRHEEWEADALYFYDPEFNILELIAHKASPASEAPFGPEQLIGLAEVGLPVTDVQTFGKELREKLGLPQWKTGNALFEAIGTASGMFIVVQEQRPWFPTQNPAIALPLRVEIQTEKAIPLRHGPYEIYPSVASTQV